MTRVILAGASGRTGLPVAAALAAAADVDLVARVAPSLAGGGPGCFGSLTEALGETTADVLVDLTRPELGEEHALAGLAAGLAVVLGTTGLDADARGRIDAAARAAELPAFYAPNFALGAVLAMQFAEQAAALLPHVEIVELHSHHKLDAPSGTAEATAERIRAVDPLGAPARAGRPPGDAARRRGAAAHDPARHDLAGGLRAWRPARRAACARAPAGSHRGARDVPDGLTGRAAGG